MRSYRPRRHNLIKVAVFREFQTNHDAALGCSGSRNKIIFPALPIHIINRIQILKHKIHELASVPEAKPTNFRSVPVFNMLKPYVIKDNISRFIKVQGLGYVF